MHRKRKVRQKGQSEGGAVETERRKKCEKQPAKGTLGTTGQWGGLKLAGEERRGAVRGKGAGIAWETSAPQGPGSQVG